MAANTLSATPPSKTHAYLFLERFVVEGVTGSVCPQARSRNGVWEKKTRETDGLASHFKFPDVSEDSYLFPPGASKKELLPLVLPGDGPGRAANLSALRQLKGTNGVTSAQYDCKHKDGDVPLKISIGICPHFSRMHILFSSLMTWSRTVHLPSALHRNAREHISCAIHLNF